MTKRGPVKVSDALFRWIKKQQNAAFEATGRTPTQSAILEQLLPGTPNQAGLKPKTPAIEAKPGVLEPHGRNTIEMPFQEWHNKLAFILNSGKQREIAAVQESISLFYDYSGGLEVEHGIAPTKPHNRDSARPKGPAKGTSSRG